MKWILLSESYIPDVIEPIKKSFNSDYTDERFTPTVEFLEHAYGYLNKKLFQEKLPTDIEFKIEHNLSDHAAGHTYANDDKNECEFVIDGVSLNGTIMMTVHSWLETILHEMIHVMDFAFYPEHFNKKINPKYDHHKGWFMKEAEKFKKYGFDIKEKLGRDDFTTSVDDEIVQSNQNDALFICVCHNPLGWNELIKIHEIDKENVLSELKKIGYTTIKILRTDNVNSSRLDFINVDSEKPLSTYHTTDQFNKNFGPFIEIEEIDLTKTKFDENIINHHRKIILEDGSEDITYLYPGLTSVIRLPNGGLRIKT